VSERRTILQVHRHGVKQILAPESSPLSQCRSVPVEIAIHHFPARIIRPARVSDEHLHPAQEALGFSPSVCGQLDQQLADARLLNRRFSRTKLSGGAFLAGKPSRTNGPTISFVAHVDDPEVAFGSRAVAGNGQDDVRIDAVMPVLTTLKRAWDTVRSTKLPVKGRT